jgi:Tol biopolymer transport system component
VVAFQSDAPRLVARDFNGLRDVFARDLGTGRTVLVSRNRCGRAGNGYSRYPALSADGTLVAFDSHATDLAATVAAGRGHVYVARPGGRPPRLLDRTPAGVVSHRTAFSPALSGDGAWVAFPSFARDLAPDQDGEVDVYTRRVAHGPVRRASSTRA